MKKRTRGPTGPDGEPVLPRMLTRTEIVNLALTDETSYTLQVYETALRIAVRHYTYDLREAEIDNFLIIAGVFVEGRHLESHK